MINQGVARGAVRLACAAFRFIALCRAARIVTIEL
jgi:hypothetical protein